MGKSSFVCPNCGALLQAGARVCRDCGSDENTGWSDGTYMDGVDLPFDDDEYEEARAREFSPPSEGGKARVYVDWRMVVGVLVAAAMLLVFVFRR
ncbi:MAG: zinc ribbon domain-containing protein [Chitinispirillales bacterium]|nr:zinc ribbon domain-containing protein [Chitinispirillales bacterium]